MLKKTIILFLFISLLPVSNLWSKEISGITMPDKLSADGQEMILNGAGVREKFFMDIYVGGLYLQEKSSNAADIIKAKTPMAIRLHIVSGLVSSEKMSDATREGFEKATDNDLSGIEDKVDRFIALFKQEEITKKDVFEFIYQPDRGVKVYKNEKHLDTLEGYDFKKALFGIWLSDDPVQDSLKEGMLGK